MLLLGRASEELSLHDGLGLIGPKKINLVLCHSLCHSNILPNPILNIKAPTLALIEAAGPRAVEDRGVSRLAGRASSSYAQSPPKPEAETLNPKP